MKSSFDILTAIYKALNVTSITSLIDGEIYKGFVPAKSQLQDVEINTLVNLNKYLQSGYINVNFYCMQLIEGVPNDTKLNQVNNALMAIIDNKVIDDIHFDVESQSGALKDREVGRDGLYFTNLKVKFNTLN